jgi:hypothetical protein
VTPTLPGSLPLAVARALRHARAHLSVERIEIIGGPEDEIACEIDIRTAMPAQWRVAGESPAGVRTVETVTFTFFPHFPLSNPRVELRDDFDRSHPHLNPVPKGRRPQPCLVAGSPREVIQARGFVGLIEQLVEWLERASTLDLNHPQGGWEPVRRDRIDDIVVVDSAALHALVDAKGGAAYLWCQYIHRDVGSGFYRIHCPVIPSVFRPRDTERFSRRRYQPDASSGQGITIAAWPGKGPGGKPLVADRYQPEDVETLGDLRARAKAYGCLDLFEAKLRHIANRLAVHPVGFTVPIAVFLLPRRPYRLAGTDSVIETCGYLIEAGSASDLRNAATPVRLLGHRDAISPAVLRRTSGDDPAAPVNRWTLIGCGSVGSKLAVHMARAGRAPTTLLDSDMIEPHNFARHAAVPFDGERQGLYLIPKTYAVAELTGSLGPEPTCLGQDALSYLLDPEGRTLLAPPGTTMIVNTTGAAVVRESYAHHAWSDRPRIAEACLLGAGKAALLAVEGENQNPNASDLMAEAYHLLRDMPDLAATIFSTEAEAIQIGQGCSAVSFALSDAQLSALTASMAMKLANWDSAGLPPQGQLLLGELGADGLSQSWSAIDVEPWLLVPGEADRPAIRISPRVDREICADVAKWPGVETGGILVGRFSPIGNCFQIVGTLPAPEDSTRSPAEFVLGTKGLAAQIKALNASTRGTLQILGTWHSHLVPSGPSSKDRMTGAVLAATQLGPLLMLIHTPDGYAALTVEAFDDEPADLVNTKEDDDGV